MRLRVTATGQEKDLESPPAELPRGVVAVRDGQAVWVKHGAETYRLERVAARPGKRAEQVEHDLRAPMPGRILRVSVEAGQEVAKGAPLLALEAMKMEHEIKAPRAGRVVRVFPSQGDMVGLGDLLVELE